MKLGIGSYTYGWETGTYGPALTEGARYLTAYDLIHRAENLGVDVVQICVRPDLTELAKPELEDLAAEAAKCHIDIELGTVGCDPQRMLQFLGIARILGARLVRTLLIEPSPGLVIEEESFRQVLERFKDVHVTIAVENHETYGCRELRELVRRISHPCFGVCLDTVNSLGRGEGVTEVAEMLAPHTVNLHIKDFTVLRGDADMGFRVTGERVGRGRLDVERLIQTVHGANPHANVILEQWTPFCHTAQETFALQRSWASEGVRELRALVPAAPG
jgi:3-oxoisoapionate decarboxylase